MRSRTYTHTYTLTHTHDLNLYAVRTYFGPWHMGHLLVTGIFFLVFYTWVEFISQALAPGVFLRCMS